MTCREFKSALLEALKEQNVSGAVGGFQSPRAFRTSSSPYNTKASRPKRPSHTKLFDFLEENN